MTHSTMSLDVGDINNDGRWEIYATDMKPYRGTEDESAAWQPLMDMMANIPMLPDDPQLMENVLQVESDPLNFANAADAYGLSATGWSWSAKFGDLDSDGYLDLYVVNGMIAADFFDHLPNNELVEENQAFRNISGNRFDTAPEWNLGSTRSGRGMSMADMDNDGDLDIIVNNLASPAQLFENQLCGGHNLTIDLKRSDTFNTAALGARLTLHTTTGTYTRLVEAASGYLSGNTSQQHFGLPEGSTIVQLEIDWGDGAISTIDNILPDTHMTLIRS